MHSKMVKNNFSQSSWLHRYVNWNSQLILMSLNSHFQNNEIKMSKTSGWKNKLEKLAHDVHCIAHELSFVTFEHHHSVCTSFNFSYFDWTPTWIDPHKKKSPNWISILTVKFHSLFYCRLLVVGYLWMYTYIVFWKFIHENPRKKGTKQAINKHVNAYNVNSDTLNVNIVTKQMNK